MSKYASFIFALLGLIWLVACGSPSTANPSGQTPSEKAFEDTVLLSEAKLSSFISAVNSLTSATTSNYGSKLRFLAGEADSFLSWVSALETSFNSLSEGSISSLQLDFDLIPPDILNTVNEIAENNDNVREALIDECIKLKWQRDDCKKIQEEATQALDNLAIAAVDLGNKLTSNPVSFLLGETPAQPSEPTAIRIKDDPALITSVLWSFCAEFASEGTKCHIASVTGTTEEDLPVPFLPPGSDKVKLVIQVKGKAPIIIETSLQDGKVTVINTANPQAAEVSTEEPELVSCDKINAFNLELSPPKPSPGQSVFVRAFTIPPAEECNIAYRVVGTDLYQDSGTLTTNSRGSVGFRIEGAEEAGISDYVEFSAENGVSADAAYTFE